MSDNRWIHLTRDLHDTMKGTKQNKFGYSIDELSNDMASGYAESKRYDDESMPFIRLTDSVSHRTDMNTGWKKHYELADEAIDLGITTTQFEEFISYCARWDIVNPSSEHLAQWVDELDINVQSPIKQVIASMDVELSSKDFDRRLPIPVIYQ